MGYHGKPSKGCDKCRSRKIRVRNSRPPPQLSLKIKQCDQGKPACRRCIQAQCGCPGYRDQLTLQFRDESQEVIRKATASSQAPKRKREAVFPASSSSRDLVDVHIPSPQPLQLLGDCHILLEPYQDPSQDDAVFLNGFAWQTPAKSVLSDSQTVIPTSDSSLEWSLDWNDRCPRVENEEFFLSSAFDGPPKLPSSCDPVKFGEKIDDASAALPLTELAEINNGNVSHKLNSGIELTDSHVDSPLCENLHGIDFYTNLGSSLDDVLNETLDANVTSPCKTDPIYLWTHAWPIQRLGYQSWTNLESAKALTLPEWATIERLLCLYFQYIHPRLPVVNERNIYHWFNLDIQSDVAPPKPISFALLNAMMYAASEVGFFIVDF